MGGLSAKNTNDKPEMGLGLKHLDDGSVLHFLQSIAPTQQRDYVVMEVKANLLGDDRKETLSTWSSTGFKKVVSVMCGNPPAAFVKRSQEVILKQKQAAADEEFRKKKEEKKNL